MDRSEREKHLARLNKFQPPEGFSSRAAAKTTATKLLRGEKVLTPEDIGKLDDLVGLLATAGLGLAAESELTFGMVKPRANEGIGLPADDDAAARAIIDEIGKSRVALQFHTLLDETQAVRLYGAETIGRLWQTPSENGEPVAKVLLGFVTSDAVTMALVHHEEGNAVEWLKYVVGATLPSQAHPNSIRGRHSRDNLMPNNLVHRSGSQNEALAEIAAFRTIVQDFIDLGKI